MNLSTETISETRAKVTVTVSGSEVTAEERAAVRDITRQAKIPGFRPGKAPRPCFAGVSPRRSPTKPSGRSSARPYEHASKESKLEIFGLVEMSDVSELKAGADAELYSLSTCSPSSSCRNTRASRQGGPGGGCRRGR
jgi:trigger factor